MTDYILMASFLLVSAFFSGSETALVSMTKLRIRRAIETHGKRGERLLEWQNNSDRLLTTILVGNNISNIAGTSIAALLVSRLIGNPELAVWVNTVIMTSLILVMSEILPKQIAKRRPEGFALRVIGPLTVIGAVIRPLVWFFGGLAHIVARAMGATKEDSGAISRADVEAIVAAAGEEGSLHRHEQMLMREALGFRRATVREIMTPRVHMRSLLASDTITEAKRVAVETGFSRLPVQGEEEGEVVGVLFAKDLLIEDEKESETSPRTVADIMRKAHFVPEMIGIERLMELFRQNQMHIAIVIGEYGDVVGLVTMEDVLERLVGQIEDEYDPMADVIRKVSPRRYLLRGTARLDDIRRQLGIELPEGDYETIGGYIVDALGKIPSRGAAIRWQGWLIQVYDASERHVLEVSLSRIGKLVDETLTSDSQSGSDEIGQDSDDA